MPIGKRVLLLSMGKRSGQHFNLEKAKVRRSDEFSAAMTTVGPKTVAPHWQPERGEMPPKPTFEPVLGSIGAVGKQSFDQAANSLRFAASGDRA